MGGCFTREPDVDFDGPVDFDHFHILRAIGKGAFGKVCIVKKKDTKEMYAMKYMNKVQIIRKHAVDNVFREIEILCKLDHPFLVNLWYTFHDQEDIFMVLDLMLGGDISYHLEKQGRFAVPRVRLYVAELSLALEYLREHRVIHRDVKPANMLLDSGGHVHLTDFNVACIVRSGVNITSVTGTKPYMAPEVLNSNCTTGYSYAVDWWGLGVSAYEMLRGQRPFPIDRHMSNDEIASNIRHTRPSASVRWDHGTCDLLKMLLHPDETKRLQSVESMRKHRFFQNTDWDQVERKETTPVYIPAQNRIHCDPTHELEEMIVEPNPLHKKHHRLSRRTFRVEDETLADALDRMERRFTIYNRIKLKGPSAEVDGVSKDSAAKEENGKEHVDHTLDATDRDTKRASNKSVEIDTAAVTGGGGGGGGDNDRPLSSETGPREDQKEEGGEGGGGGGREEKEEVSSRTEKHGQTTTLLTVHSNGDDADDKTSLLDDDPVKSGGPQEEEPERRRRSEDEETSGIRTTLVEVIDSTSQPTNPPENELIAQAGQSLPTTEGSNSSELNTVENPSSSLGEPPVVSGSTASTDAESSAVSTQDDSPTQPDPVERTDSMSSGALLLPRER